MVSDSNSPSRFDGFSSAIDESIEPTLASLKSLPARCNNFRFSLVSRTSGDSPQNTNGLGRWQTQSMARPLRIEFPGAICHATSRMVGSWWNGLERLFRDARDFGLFVERLECIGNQPRRRD